MIQVLTSRTRIGILAHCGLALLLLGSAPRVPRAAAATPAPALQGDVAWAELERRGEKEPLLDALDAARYDARPMEATPGTLLVDNPAQLLRATFAPDSVRLRAGASAMRLHPIGIGYGETLTPMAHLAIRADGPRVEIDRTSNVTEWWVNRASGLEQGYTVRQAPVGRAGGAWLRVVVTVDGELTPQVAADGQSATFVTADGTPWLLYDHLQVRDATGRLLPARMRADAATLSLETDDTQAAYPVTIDPTFSTPTYLKASNTGGNDWFGISVAVSGNTAVVGAVGESGSGTGIDPASNENAPSAGAAYVFVLTGATWSQQAYLKASNTGDTDWFGASVAVSGDTVVVGAPYEDGSGVGVNPASNENAIGAGAAYVFVRSGTTWSPQAYLKASNTIPQDSNGGNGDGFGFAVAVSGNTVVVGARCEDGSGTGANPVSNESLSCAGAAYVFVRSATTWSQEAYLKASNTGGFDQFGVSVAVSGDTVVVGAGGEASASTGINGNQVDNSAGDAGAAYVFVRNGGAWSQQAYLKASNTGGSDQFGASVAVSGDTVVVGASQEDGSGTGVNPASNESALNAGAAYVFVRTGTTWSQEAHLKASNTGGNDGFGISVAVSGDTVVVGAHLEDGSGTGVDPASNENAVNAGAAYVFVRNETTWSQQAYLKASNTEAGDQFGASMAVSGNTVVAGASREDGSGTGVDPVSNNSADAAGAAYVFISIIPEAPTIMGITAGNGQLTVNFTAGAPGGSALTNYEYSTNNGATFAARSPVATTSPLVISGLANGTTYTVRIRAVNVNGAGAASPSSPGTPVLSGPVNDFFVNALVVSSIPFQSVVNTTDATTTAEDPLVTCGSGSTLHSVWYVFTPSVSGPVSIDTFGSGYDTILSVYTGSPGSFSPVDCDDDSGGTVQSLLTIQGLAGQRLAILVSSFSTLGGVMSLNVSMANPPGAFSKTTPTNGAVNQPMATMLTWGAASGATSYEYCIDTTNNNACNTSWVSTGTATTATLSPLPANTAHYWQVRANNGTGTTYAEGAATSFWSFTTGSPGPAFGQVDTPAQNATGVQGAIGVTGWALDDVGVANVKIYRPCLGIDNPLSCQEILGQSVVFVGDAAFLPGARPDVEAAFPAYPNGNAAGWGMQILTNMLPHIPNGLLYGGQGALTLYVYATDLEGHIRLLGRSSDPLSADYATPTFITMGNDTIAKPFGTIDTPTLGGTVSGTIANFGWVLTPDANTTSEDPGDILMTTSGAGMVVYIDGIPTSTVVYNQCRGTVGNPPGAGVFCNDDIANIFGNPTPQATLMPRTSNPTRFRNLDATRSAIGAYVLNTTTLTNGRHEIAWGVADSAARGEGIGSRFFTVLNAGADQRTEAQLREASAEVLGLAVALEAHTPGAEGVYGRAGYGLDHAWKLMYAGQTGTYTVRLPESGRLELWLGGPVQAGYLVANGTLRPLPVGSTLAGSYFAWMPPVGYVGPYTLSFVRDRERIDVQVTVRPVVAAPVGESEVRMHLDSVRSAECAVLGAACAVRIEGWAFDPQASIGSGIGSVHVWARTLDLTGLKAGAVAGQQPPVFLGEAALDVARPDVAGAIPNAPAHAGYQLISPLGAGTWELTAYVWNERTARWEDARSVTVIVR